MRFKPNVGNGLPEVVEVVPASPAEAAKMRIGDVISHVDGRSIRGLAFTQAVHMIRGVAIDSVELTIVRGSSTNVHKVARTPLSNLLH